MLRRRFQQAPSGLPSGYCYIALQVSAASQFFFRLVPNAPWTHKPAATSVSTDGQSRIQPDGERDASLDHPRALVEHIDRGGVIDSPIRSTPHLPAYRSAVPQRTTSPSSNQQPNLCGRKRQEHRTHDPFGEGNVPAHRPRHRIVSSPWASFRGTSRSIWPCV